MMHNNFPDVPHVIFVTVTYGKRWHLLEQSIRSVVKQGISKAIIVNNGSLEPIAELGRESFGDIVDVVELGVNTGSANGFKVGIETALLNSPDFILLLDDDNLLSAGGIQILLSSYKQLKAESYASEIAVAALRPDHHSDIVSGRPYEYSIPHADSFLGFHAPHLPFKIISKLFGIKSNSVAGSLKEFIKIDTAPYSGLLFPASLIESIGLPNSDFVLYADDTDFSFRLTQQGGAIWVVSAVEISDIEPSWSVKKNFKSSFDALLTGQGDLRAYYAMRNQAYFEMHCRPHHPKIRRLNKMLYLVVLWARAWALKKKGRFHLIRMAIRHGEEGKLGVNPDFPLYVGNG